MFHGVDNIRWSPTCIPATISIQSYYPLVGSLLHVTRSIRTRYSLSQKALACAFPTDNERIDVVLTEVAFFLLFNCVAFGPTCDEALNDHHRVFPVFKYAIF